MTMRHDYWRDAAERLNSLPLNGRRQVWLKEDISLRVQYQWGHWGLSVISGESLHHFPCEWEIAILFFKNEDPLRRVIVGTTPLTYPDNVKTIFSREEAVQFINEAREWFREIGEEWIKRNSTLLGSGEGDGV